MKQFCGMTQAIKFKKNNDFPSTGIMEKYFIGTQNTWLEISGSLNILQTGRKNLHAIHREHSETNTEKNHMLSTENTRKHRQEFQYKSHRKAIPTRTLPQTPERKQPYQMEC